MILRVLQLDQHRKGALAGPAHNREKSDLFVPCGADVGGYKRNVLARKAEQAKKPQSSALQDRLQGNSGSLRTTFRCSLFWPESHPWSSSSATATRSFSDESPGLGIFDHRFLDDDRARTLVGGRGPRCSWASRAPSSWAFRLQFAALTDVTAQTRSRKSRPTTRPRRTPPEVAEPSECLARNTLPSAPQKANSPAAVQSRQEVSTNTRSPCAIPSIGLSSATMTVSEGDASNRVCSRPFGSFHVLSRRAARRA